MRIKVKNKVVDLSLVEEMNITDKVFYILLNNGRSLEFLPEPVEMKPLLTGTPPELDSYMKMQRDRSMGMEKEDLKDLFYTDKGSRDGGKYVLSLFDKKEQERKHLENYEKLASTYKWVKEQYEEYLKDNVRYEESN